MRINGKLVSWETNIFFSTSWFMVIKIRGQVALLPNQIAVLFYHKYLWKESIEDETPKNETFNWACSGNLLLLFLWKMKWNIYLLKGLFINLKITVVHPIQNSCRITLWNLTNNLSPPSLYFGMSTSCVSFSIWKYDKMVRYLKGWVIMVGKKLNKLP